MYTGQIAPSSNSRAGISPTFSRGSSAGAGFSASLVQTFAQAIQAAGFAGYPPATSIPGLSPLYSMRAIPLQAQNNSLTMGTGNVAYQLGTFDGKQVAFRFLSGGGLETTASAQPTDYVGGTGSTSLANSIATAISGSYSAGTASSVASQADFIGSLYLLAGGKMSAASFNQGTVQAKTNVKAALEQLGIDPARAFTLNGRSFTLHGNTLSAA